MSEVTLNPLECALDEAQALRGQVDALQAENAKLKQELEAVGTAAYLYGRDDLKAENAKLRELLAGDETQRRIAGIGEGTVPTYHGTDTVDEARLVVENAKLWELAHLVAVAEYTSVDQCDGCVAKRACNAGELDMCWIRKAILEKLRELGVEVDV